jgi:hypothetical protein
VQRALQPLAHLALLELAELLGHRRAIAGERLRPVGERHCELALGGDLLVAAALVELRFRERLLRRRDTEPRLRGIAFGPGERLFEALQALHDRLDLLRARFQRVLRLLHLEALALLLLLDRRELGADRLAPLLRLLRALRELAVFDFGPVCGRHTRCVVENNALCDRQANWPAVHARLQSQIDLAVRV